MFDDCLHTVYGAGREDVVTDTICDLLWENNREIYAEDEYFPDGLLIYMPPPLNKVWLDKEGLLNQCTWLLDQCQCNEHHIRNQTQAVEPQCQTLKVKWLF